MDNIIVQGLFDMSKDGAYVILKEDKTEVGTLKIKKGEIVAKVGNVPEHTFDSKDELIDYISENHYVLATETPRWTEYNPNPKGNKTVDCTIRAYCAAENITWEEAYDLASKYGRDLGLILTDDKCCHAILEEHFGYEYVKLDKEEKGITVKEFAIAHPKGTFVMSVPRHLVTIVNGEYWDSWDSGDKKVKGYYVRK